MSSSATGVGMPICFLGAILLILTQKSSQKFGDVLGISYLKNGKYHGMETFLRQLQMATFFSKQVFRQQLPYYIRLNQFLWE